MTSKHLDVSEEAPAFRIGADESPAVAPGPKRSVNLSVSQALLDEAKALGLNLSETLRDALATQIRVERARRWRAENEGALKSYGDYLEANGLFGARYRTW